MDRGQNFDVQYATSSASACARFFSKASWISVIRFTSIECQVFNLCNAESC